MSNGLWKRRFGSDPSVLRETLSLNGRSFTVVGVMPAGFDFPAKTELWVPAAPREGLFMGAVVFKLIGRLAPDFSLEQAQTEMDVLSQRERTSSGDPRIIQLHPLKTELYGEIRPALLILLGAVGLVLLITCSNAGNLLLARAAARRQEMAIRSAMGGSRLRLVRQLLTESAVLALAAGVLGLAFASVGLQIVITQVPTEVPLLERASIDARVMGFALGLSFVTALLFGLFPALRTSRVDLHETLKVGGGGGRARRPLSSALVIAQVALATALSISAGLLINSFGRVLAIQPGFNPEGVLVMELSTVGPKYKERSDRIHLYNRAIERFRALPGAVAAGATSSLPLSGQRDMRLGVSVEGQPEIDPEDLPQAAYRIATPGYFRAMGIPLMAGREFTDRDIREAPEVAVVNFALARKLFGEADPIGRRVKLVGFSPEPWREVVGVVDDVRHDGLESESKMEFYQPHAQQPWPVMSIAIRCASDPTGLIGLAREEVHALDPDLPINNVRTMTTALSEAVSERRFSTSLMGFFAVAALVLAALGVYSVMSYLVGLRTREIGVQMALGATRSHVSRRIMVRALKLVAAGIGLGLIVALEATKLLSGLLFGLTSVDPETYVVVVFILLAVALPAAFLPARRAASLDPIVALRYE
jgi:putative ABC transport system permease protein